MSCHMDVPDALILGERSGSEAAATEARRRMDEFECPHQFRRCHRDKKEEPTSQPVHMATASTKCAARKLTVGSISLIGLLLLVVATTNERILVQAYEFTIQHTGQQQAQPKTMMNAAERAPMPPFVELPSQLEYLVDGGDQPSNSEAGRDRSPDQSADSEDQQLRQLHQVVDTVAHLLNEEEEQRRRQEQQGHENLARLQQQQEQNLRLPQAAALQSVASPPVDYQIQDVFAEAASEQRPVRIAPLNDQQPDLPAELMSESAIRQAIEELERVQQLERANAGAGEKQPNNNNHENAGDKSAAASKQLESFIDQLDEELLNDRMAKASQDTERLVAQQSRARSEFAPAQVASGERQKSDATFVSAAVQTPPMSQQASQDNSEANRQPHEIDNNEKTGSRSSSLVVGQLDSVDSAELGTALANDFYSFHAESIGAVSHHSPPADEPHTASGASENSNAREQQQQQAPVSAQAQPQQQTQNAISSRSDPDVPQQQAADQKQAKSDLDSAAQMRSSQSRFANGQPFDQSQPSSLSLDFSQPETNNQQVNPNGNNNSNQLQPEQILQAFRAPNQQQQNQFTPPTSTLLPFAETNFWRPSSSNDLNQQFDRFAGGPPQDSTSLPPLPSSRFQNLASPAPFLQAQQRGHQQPTQQQQPRQHVHFTGHSFISADPFQIGGNPPQPQQQTARQSFSSTPQPIVSVISGNEPIGSNSVSWNPPAAVNPPPVFQQPPLQATFAPLPSSTSSTTTPSPDSGSPLFRSAFQNLSPAQDPQQQQSSFRPLSGGLSSNNRNILLSLNEHNARPPAPSENQRQEPSTAPTAQQWSPAFSTSSPSLRPPFQSTASTLAPASEREAADSRPLSTIRSLQAHSSQQARHQQQFFSQEEPIITTTSSSQSQRASSLAPANFLPSSSTTEFPSTSTVQGGSAGAGSRNTLASAPPSAGDATTPVSNSTSKKDDMVIYYYYYYDDNKNATVVAKNISATAAGHINGASIPSDSSGLDSDGGLEDTPYMEDAIPSPQPPELSANSGVRSNFGPSSSSSASINLQPQNGPASAPTPRQPSSTTSTTTTTTTTTSSTTIPSVLFANTFESAIHNNGRQRQHSDNQLAGHHQLRVSTPPSVRSSSPRPIEGRFESLPSSGSNEDAESDYDQPQSDQERPSQAADERRLPVGPQTRPTSVNNLNNHQHRQHHPEPTFASSASPSVANSPTSTFKPAPIHREPLPTPSHESHHPHSNQFTAPPPNTRAQQQQQQVSRFESPTRGQANARPLNTNQPQQPNNRANLSNASRYGTSTGNQFLDPYGLDPAAAPPVPPTQAHHSHHQEPSSAHHAKNHNQPAQKPAASSGQSQQQVNRRPNSSLMDSVLASSGARPANTGQDPDNGPQQAGARLPSSQHFSPKRQQAQANQPAAGAHAVQPAPQQRAPAPSPAPTRQASPESSPAQNSQERVSNTSSQRPQLARTQQQQGVVSQPQPASVPVESSGPTADSDQEAEMIPPAKVDVSRANINNQRTPPATANGRPANAEGSISNGFTQVPPTSLSSGSQRLSTTSQRLSSAASIATESPVPTISTSVSRSFSLPPSGSSQPQQIQMSISSSPTTSTTSSSSVSSQDFDSQTQRQQLQTTFATSQPSLATTMISSTTPTAPTFASTTTTTTTTTTPAPTQPAQEMSQPPTTESAESSAASTRRRFGNRTNRFQTRLNAVRASSATSTTTSTTAAPYNAAPSSISTTTRRPLASTTRKTSKQLFAGRRRLGGSTASTTSSDGSVPNANGGSSGAVSTETPPASSSTISSGGNPQTSSISASRARFGGNFAGRPRTTGSANAQAQGASTAKAPSLFGGSQRATFKPRLPVMKSSSTAKPAGDSTAETNSADPAASSLSDTNSSESAALTDGQAASSSATNTMGGGGDSNQTEPASDQQRNTNSRETPAGDTSAPNVTPTAVSTSTTTTTTTSAPNETSSTVRGNKPKRPLFASRQRNSSLFGNRRSNGGESFPAS